MQTSPSALPSSSSRTTSSLLNSRDYKFPKHAHLLLVCALFIILICIVYMIAQWLIAVNTAATSAGSHVLPNSGDDSSHNILVNHEHFRQSIISGNNNPTTPPTTITSSH
ncbi:hypothetical protein FDP41_009293 [Naegleria fowleri]|uniref:Uncharacterized protein n=1 Tax=Naegleria fowleri TaxID=5763 RepID=A0A6A5BE90_NAEFO|nr:uncharacterized protein FDP41_009293 [Naegleria fowleri]KAF0972390.1 hypothetical protein FDP41_009293 [Naegleria fowleri]CAG4707839.1 unnamed protein product [Naegleria fowleri]